MFKKKFFPKYINISIIGKPNVGKSTLLNNIINYKISIISKKIQTTRFNIKGIETINNYQYVYIDTPGFQKKYKNTLNNFLNKNIINSINYSNLILFIININCLNKFDKLIFNYIPKNIFSILILNKLDNKKYNLNLISFFLKKINLIYKFNYTEIISSKYKIRLFFLKNLLNNFFIFKKHLFKYKYITNKNKKFLIKEIIREKIFFFLNNELPYIINISIEKIIKKKNKIIFNIIINVKKKSHKLILLGKKNLFLKKIIYYSIIDIKKIFLLKFINLNILIKN